MHFCQDRQRQLSWHARDKDGSPSRRSSKYPSRLRRRLESPLETDRADSPQRRRKETPEPKQPSIYASRALLISSLEARSPIIAHYKNLRDTAIAHLAHSRRQQACLNTVMRHVNQGKAKLALEA